MLLESDAETLRADRGLLRQLTETFFYRDLRRRAGCHPGSLRSFHFRDNDGVLVTAGSTVFVADSLGL